MSAPDTPVSAASSLLRHLAAFAVFSTASVVLMLVALPLLPWRGLRIRAGNVVGKLCGPIVLWIAGIRVQVEHRERLDGQAPAIYVPNHSSEADPWVSIWLCPIGGCGVAKRQIARIPFFGQAYWLVGHLLIDRDDRSSAVASMAALGELVRRLRLSVWMWPEGTQSKDGRLLPFKPGFVHLAIATGLPVVPVVFHDAHLRWPARSRTLIPGTLRVEVLEAIDTRGWRAEDARAHAEQVRQVVAARLAPHQRPIEPA